ncbi:MAG: hypothetical protein R3B96_08380 [Pirellulaceae bacterium]
MLEPAGNHRLVPKALFQFLVIGHAGQDAFDDDLASQLLVVGSSHDAAATLP